MNDDSITSSLRLRNEIGAFGESYTGKAAARYLTDSAPAQVIADLRQAARTGGEAFSPTLSLMLKLDDDTLKLIIAALRDTTGAAAGQSPSEETVNDSALLTGALAESYIQQHRMSAMLSTTMDVMKRLLKRVERAGANLEAEAVSRDALRIIGTHRDWQANPDNPHILNVLDELATAARLNGNISTGSQLGMNG